MSKENEEKVNHPKHYNVHPSGIECITIVEHFNFNIGNAVKYIWRAGLKSSSSTVEDLQKAVWYLNREINRIKPDYIIHICCQCGTSCAKNLYLNCPNCNLKIEK